MILPDNRYILFRREWDSEKQKWNKVPCDHIGKSIDAHNPEHWMSKDNAGQFPTWTDHDPSKPYGLAWVLNGDGWFFIDLDKCYVDGDWTSDASAFFKSFSGCLGEVSTSGTGLHIFGRCDPEQLKDRRNKWGGDKEFYIDKRFVALSQSGPSPIGGKWHDFDWTKQLRKAVPERVNLGDMPNGTDPTYTGPKDDEELIALMLASNGGAGASFGLKARIADLWHTNADILAKHYPAFNGNGGFDHSSADAALMTHLAFWTGKDMPRMDRLFRQSALMRDKYANRADYRRDTIQNATRLCNKVYSVGPNKPLYADTIDDWEPLPTAFTQPELQLAPPLDLAAFLPPALAQWVNDAAMAKSAPPDYVFFAFLCVATSLIGNARKVSPKPSWSQALALWPMCIGNPSAGKSPALDAVIDPLRAVERPIRKRAEAEFAAWKSKKALADIAEDVWKKSVKAALAQGEEPPGRPDMISIPPEPHMPRLMVTDCTIEKLATICAAQPKGVLQFRDELSGWLLGMVRYSNSSDRPFWLEANGGRSYSVERVGRDTVTIPRLLINVLGGIQPDKLKSLLIDGDDDGLLARFVPVWPDQVPLEDHQGAYSDKAAQDVFDRLLSLKMPPDQNGDPTSITRSFDDDARKSFHSFRQRLRHLEGNSNGPMLPFLGKLAGLTATLSLLRAHIRWAHLGEVTEPNLIGTDDVVAAIALAETYIIPMAQRSYAAFGATKEIFDAINLLDVIRSHGWKEFTRRELQRSLGKRISCARDLEAQLKELIAVDALREANVETGPQGGRPSRRFVVNPYVHLKV